jgi:glycine cleavage system H protein
MNFTRRQFLKEAGIAVGGALALAALPGCGSEEPSGTTPSTGGESKSSTPMQSETSSTNATVNISTAAPTTTTAAPNTPASGLVMLDVPGCTTKVAADRLYSVENLWVKPSEGTGATLGVTDRMQALMANVISVSFKPAGDSFEQGETFGYIEASKMSVDLISPVSGKILETNAGLAGVSDNELGPINIDPYGAGWMVKVNLSKPDEVKLLLTPEEYVKLTAKEV